MHLHLLYRAAVWQLASLNVGLQVMAAEGRGLGCGNACTELPIDWRPQQVKVFSRNCTDSTGAFPDVGDALRAAAVGRTFFSFIIHRRPVMSVPHGATKKRHKNMRPAILLQTNQCQALS